MPKYNYKARSNEGLLVEGEIDAMDVESVKFTLDDMGYLPVNIAENKINYFDKLKNRFSSISLEEKLIFSRQFSTLTAAGVPVVQALTALEQQAISPKMSKVIGAVREEIEAGAGMEEAMSNYPEMFDDLFLGMIKAGEVGGVLDVMLDRLSLLQEHDFDTRERLKSATSYPKKVFFFMSAAFIGLITYIVPIFVGVFSEYGVELPLPTRILIGVSNFFHDFWILMIVLFVGLFVGANRYLKTAEGKLRVDGIKLKLPVLGEIFEKTAMSKFAGIFGILTGAGLTVTEALEVTSKTVGNVLISKVIMDIKNAVSEGSNIVDPMRISNVFPPVVIQMVSIGEETGSLEEVLFKVSEYYDRDVDYALKRLSDNIEPLLLLFMAIVILILAAGIFMPYWDMVNVLKM